MPTNQTPEELAEECKRLAQALWAQQRPSLDTLGELRTTIARLRDMAASRAKECAALQRDAERWQFVRARFRPMSQYMDGTKSWVPSSVGPGSLRGATFEDAIDAAIAATKRG